MKCWFDGQLVPLESVRVSPLAHSLHYGGAVFEGIRFYEFIHNGRRCVFRLEDHIHRLLASARIMGMESPYSTDELCEAVLSTVRQSDLYADYIRPVIFRGEGIGLNSENLRTHVMIALVVLPWQQTIKPIELVTSRFIRLHPQSTEITAKVAGHYVNSYLAAMEAKKAGADDALLLDHKGNVAETSIANVFFVKGESIFTPRLGSIFPGLTRDCIIDFCENFRPPKFGKMQIEQRDISLEEAMSADAMFVTGTACEVLPVAKLNGKQFDTQNPRVLFLQQMYWGMVLNSIPCHQPSWLSVVDSEDFPLAPKIERSL